MPISTRLALVTAFCGLFSFTSYPAQPAKGAGEHPREWIIKFKATANDAAIEDSLRHGALKVRKHLQTAPMARHDHPGLSAANSELPVAEVLTRLKNHPAIEYIEPNFLYSPQLNSNDPYVTNGSLWGAYGDQSSPSNVYGSQAAEAWAKGYTGTNTMFVAVLDEGIQITHPDLSPNIWTNPYDPQDGVDNDRNGYVDDSNGWNFHGNSRVVFDPAGDTHGTHVAGTIGAKGGNGIGIAGVNWNVSIIPGKFISGGTGSSLDAVEAIDYFIDLKTRHGINLVAINASWGGSGYSQSLHDAIIRAAKAGILFIAAAGNSSSNNDQVGSYPSNLDTRNGTSTQSAASYNAVISVAAIDRNGALASFSSYGATRVHLGAPGVSIYSTLPSNTYGPYQGTSMATPHVTGAAALYASSHPGASAQEIRSAILNSVAPTPSLAGKTSTGGRLDLSTIIVPQVTNSAKMVGVDATTQGAWKNKYGKEGYRIIADSASFPAWATVAPQTHAEWVWTQSATETRALERAASTNRLAACWFSSSAFVINVNLTDGKAHKVSFYCMDYAAGTRAQRVDVLDGSTGALLSSFDLSNFASGKYLSWEITGNVKFQFVRTGSYNAVVSGVFIDAPPSSLASDATFLGSDSITQGDWKGKYGSEGFDIPADETQLPAWAEVGTDQPNEWLWTSSTTDRRALERASSTERLASCFYSKASFTIGFELQDGKSHKISFYCLDYAAGTRTQRIEVIDPATGRVLDCRDLANFASGIYLSWNVKGQVEFRFTRTGPYNCVASGYFIDPSF